jgi:predicted MFS family arabinose efflux permease
MLPCTFMSAAGSTVGAARRGSALALISSGTYLAGAMWPPVFEQAIANFGWRQAMLWYALAEIVVIVPLAAIYFRAPPEVIHPAAGSGASSSKARVLGWPPNAVFAVMCGAAVLCCIPMAMPQGHLVAFCGDLGISRSMGALMLSVLLGTAFLSRQIWGVLSDRIGGLATVLIGSAWQAASMTAFLFTQNEAGLFTVAAAFPASSRLMSWQCANCFRLWKPHGESRRCCCSAG